jgi:microcystin-dependent protein
VSQPFIAEIKMFAGNFAPRGYAFCDGQLLSIAQNTALFSLIGTTYGGNGITTFGLPDLRGRVPMHQGQGPGLTSRVIGELSGEEVHTLSTPELPVHNHSVGAATTASSKNPTNNVPAFTAGGSSYAAAPTTTMNASMVGGGGGNQPHNNMQPYLVVSFIIALVGIFPSRN